MAITPRLLMPPHCAFTNSDRTERHEHSEPGIPNTPEAGLGCDLNRPVSLPSCPSPRRKTYTLTTSVPPIHPKPAQPLQTGYLFHSSRRDGLGQTPKQRSPTHHALDNLHLLAAAPSSDQRILPSRFNTLHISEHTPSRHDEQTNSSQEGGRSPQQLQLQRQRQQRPQQPPTHPRIRLRVRRGTTHGVARRRSTTCHPVG